MIFRIKSDVYSQPDEEGNSKLIKKGVVTRMEIPINQIRMVEEIVTSKGQVSKTSCSINTFDNQTIRIYERFSEIAKLIKPIKIIGFGRR